MSFEITNKLSEVAYKKFKQLVYYEKNQQFLRKRLAEFECSDDFEKKLKAVEKVALSDHPVQTKAFQRWLSEISFVLVPKSVAPHHRKKGDGLFVTNVTTHSRYDAPKVNYFFDGPIELHLIAVIWSMKQGVHLDRRLGRHCKGSRLHPLVGDGEDYSAHLFQKYHELYAEWRDGGIRKARELLFNEQSSVCILALDLQEYYYRIQIDWDALEVAATSSGRRSKAQNVSGEDVYGGLSSCIKAICESYKTCIAESLVATHPELPAEATCLPIGFPCSPIIANWYLTEFDTAIIKEVRPAYYSRYVDDILIVLARDLDPESDPIDGLMKDVFERAGVFKTEGEASRYKVATTPGLFLQKSKCILQYFEAGHSFAGLEKFRKQLEQNASDFALLPIEGEDSPVEQVAYDLLYDGSANKLRSVKEIVENRWELAKHLSKQTQLYLIAESDLDGHMKQELFRFFKGSNAIDYWDMWERVIAFFTVAGSSRSVKEFNQAILSEIKKLRFARSATITAKLQEDLRHHLSLCTEASAAVRTSGRSKDAAAAMWRSSNLIRHHLVKVPLLNFTNFTGDFVAPTSEAEGELDSRKVHLTPRYVHFDECVNLVESGFLAIAEHDDNSLETADLVYSQFHGGGNGEVTSEVIAGKATV